MKRLLASVVRFPDRLRVPWPESLLGFRWLWFCGGHGPGETPGPIPNPEAKAWRGDGTALGRVWESSTPPHLFLFGGVPLFDGNPAILLSAEERTGSRWSKIVLKYVFQCVPKHRNTYLDS